MKRFLCTAVILFLSGCGDFVYGVDIVNYGQSGVILLQVGKQEGQIRKPYKVMGANGQERWITRVTSPGMEDIPFVIAMTPQIPSIRYRDPTTSFGRFKGYERVPPQTLEVVWQLAELTKCSTNIRADRPLEYGVNTNTEVRKRSYEQRHRERLNELVRAGYNPADHANKSGCTWHPQSNKIYRKTLDLKSVRDTEAYKKTGKPYSGISMSRFQLNLTLIFIEDEITVKAESRVTNPWK